ncbi:palmitoyltransferase ZDHHC16-like [Hydra vulgaris]|uniref:palmitoyltransferase ZDHHC16-like n=1 Tax=Hydra vulgaris TaxID=6087 RepID=UPI001F5EDED2|nr:palmitoyltransferase ZDHHC16-like isoform X1 [Hydra vulgaris]
MQSWRHFRKNFHILKFTLKSLFYNSSRSTNHYIDAAFEPLFWFVDHFTAYLGVIFVIIVALATSSVVGIWYIFLFPIICTYSGVWIFFHCVLAHYLLVNIVFHYYKAVTTHPGSPPQDALLDTIQQAVICKKCIQSKPPRTHHCSICSKCYLKMDHHCPWMNNCIGFYNHRYFVSFCIFMWMGTLYVSLSTYSIFIYHSFNPKMLLKNSFPFSDSVLPLVQKLVGNQNVTDIITNKLNKAGEEYGPHPAGFTQVHEYEHVAIIYLFFLCCAVTIALTLLNMWHMTLVSRGETSIEVHINSSERRHAATQGMGYNNPYNYGWYKNWKLFLGINKERGLLAILLPSSHLPEGNGMQWISNEKPIHYVDPAAYNRYEKEQRKWFFCRFCPC